MLTFPSNPNTGDVFAPGPGLPSWIWDGDKWTRGSGAGFTLEALADVVVTDLTDGQMLTWDAGVEKWINTSPEPPRDWIGPNTTNSLSWNAAGEFFLNPPQSGIALRVNGTYGANAFSFNAPVNAVGLFNSTESRGPYVTWQVNGVGIGDIGSCLANLGFGTAADMSIAVRGNNSLYLSTNAQDRMSIGGAGNVVINEPSSQEATLSVYGRSDQSAAVFYNEHGANALATQGAVQFYTVDWRTGFYMDADGRVTINAPTSLQALTVNGNGVNTIFQGNNPTLYVRDTGPTGAILALAASNTGYEINFTYMNNWPGTAWIKVANNNVMSFGPYGNVVINSPSSGVGLIVHGNHPGQYAQYILNESGAGSGGLYLVAGRTGSEYNLFCTDSWQQMTYFGVRGDGQIAMPQMWAGSGTPVQIQSGTGLLVQNNSAARFKTDVSLLKRQRARQTVAKLRAINYRYKTEAEHHYGLIAEEVAAVDPQLVIYDDDGAPCSVMYDRVAMLLLPLVQELLGMDEPTGEFSDVSFPAKS